MSTHQQSKPRAAKWSITEESGRPGTCRSKVGCDAMEEPCTNRIRPAAPVGSDAYFSNRNRRTSPFCVQCSSPRIAAGGATGLCMRVLHNSDTAVMAHRIRQPQPLSGQGALGYTPRDNDGRADMKFSFIVVAAVLLPGAAGAADIKVLSTQATEQAYREL